MTIQTTSSRAGPYIGNGSTTTWSANFRIDNQADLQVIHTNGAGLETILNAAQYSVSGLGNPAGIIVTYPLSGPPMAATEKLSILRVVPYDQQTSITNQGGFYPQVIEKALDRIVFQIQQLAEKMGRAVTVGVSSGIDPSDILAVINETAASVAEDREFIEQALTDLNLVQATETQLGIARVATEAEAAAGTDDTTFITPKKLRSSRENPAESFVIAVTNETAPLTAGANKIRFRIPYAFTLTEVRASLNVAQTSGDVVTIDINENGTSVLSTRLTIDNGEKTSKTAATPAVISDPGIADDSEIGVDIDQIGDGTAQGLKIVLIGVKA